MPSCAKRSPASSAAAGPTCRSCAPSSGRSRAWPEGKIMNAPISRREFLQASGALVVSVLVPFEESIAQVVSAARQNLVPGELESWIAVLANGRVQAFFGKMDMGQSLEPAIAQIVADELDVPFERVDVLMGDTGTSPNPGGASGSAGVSLAARA